MIKKPFLISLLFLTIPFFISAQQQGRSSLAGYYVPPMDIPLILSANFAETRTNHFHSGIDIKTEGVEGKTLRSAADGYIARVGVAPYGFGRVLYISHPNGTSSVYAHMQRFRPDIEEYLDQGRHNNKKSAIDLYPAVDRFPVKKGDVIGLSGNSGSSLGPHLHFEIRQTASQRPLSVLTREVYRIKDDIPPMILNLYYIEVDTLDGVPVNYDPVKIPVRQLSAGEYVLAGSPIFEVGRKGYFVIEVTDRKNDTSNTFGVYSIRALLDDKQYFSFSLDEFLFAETRYVNSLMHYGLQRGSRNQLIRLAVQENNKLRIYNGVRDRGLIAISDDDIHGLRFEVEDDNLNISTLELRIRRSDSGQYESMNRMTAGRPVFTDKDWNYNQDGLKVKIPAGALYEPVYFTTSVTDAPGFESSVVRPLSRLYRVHDSSIPIHSNISVSIDYSPAGSVPQDKLLLGVVSADGTKITSAGGKYSGGSVTATVRNFGTYCVVADTSPPVVSPSFEEGADLRGINSVSFRISDDFSGILSYSATIDGKWIPLEHNIMKGILSHDFNSKRISYSGGKHLLEIKVRDGAGNITTVKRNFVR